MKTLVVLPVFGVILAATVPARGGQSDVSVTVLPGSVGLAGGDTQTFEALVSNATDTTVTWSVREGADGGAITPSGVYTAPASSGIYHVVATSNEDPNSSGVALAVVSGLPAQAPLSNVKARVRGDSAAVSFDLVDGARDYRVYPLPDDSDVLLLPGGDVAVQNAIYRCAGDREVPPVPTDGEPQIPGGAVRALVAANVLGFTRTQADATLGYVYTLAGPGRVPVYALGNPAPGADNPCYFQRWNASRAKKYVTSESERGSLLAAGWRDDGIAFYASSESEDTTQVLTALSGETRLYFSDDTEAAARSSLGPTLAFLVKAAPADGAAPLMRAYYENGCGFSHDELAVGQAMFERIIHQGNLPLNHLLWSGLTRPTTLVVEALDQGCPFQGHLSPESFPADEHQAFLTLEDIQGQAANGEVFVNGQHEPDNRPQAIARSFVEVEPQATEALDFYDTFADPLGDFIETRPIFQTVRREYENYDVGFYSVELPKFAIGTMLGELWVTYSDWASDTDGKFRLTPKRWATLAADSFLHVTMEVDIFGTDRRYPQILVSDRSWPVQEQLVDGATLVFQTFSTAPQRMDIELCDHRNWEVNDQCPRFVVENGHDLSGPFRPQPEVSEHMGVDRRARVDVYASTLRAYLFLDGLAYGCADLPEGQMPAGPATVTFGDALYHSGVDVPDPYFRFHQEHMHLETRRHFDEIGFISGVAAPPWDESLLPCAANPVP